jgi:hypothetical protein
MRLMILISIAAGAAFAGAGAANGQTTAPTGNVGSGPRSQDVAASHRESDNDYNLIASRGVEVTNMDRADAKRGLKRHSAVPATASDVVAGAHIRDVKGVSVGVVATLAANEVADPDSVVVDTGQTKIGVPLSAFGKDDKGLMMSITAQNFNQLVAQANTQAPASQSKSN